LSWYGWKTSEFEKKLEKVTCSFDRKTCEVLEIGSGPIRILSYLKWGKKYALDPLSDFYKEKPALVALRDNTVNFIKGTGEQIPFPDGYFPIVIIDNILDHVSDPDAVLNEIYRVLSNSGILYIKLNINTS
jgi:ubiquinone/menaquinone biosynthesis C-methylase UbiE